MKINKRVLSFTAFIAVLSLLFSTQVFAMSANDYKNLQFGKATDSGGNTITVSGKGFFGTTTTQGPDYASAVLYNNPVDPKNFNCVLQFINDYGQGEGSQAGWYAINFGKTMNWFSSVKAVVQKASINGVAMIFKLNPNNKKEIIIELNRYSPGSGFINIFGSSITKTLKNDWVCNINIKNGILSIDNNQVLDLSDAFDIAIGSGNKSYVGFGGFSENHYDIKMNVTYTGVAAPSVSSTAPSVSSKASSSGGTSSKPSLSDKTGSSQTSTSSGTASSTSAVTSNNSASVTATSSDTSSDAAQSSTFSSSSSQSNSGNIKKSKGFNWGLLIVGAAVLLLAGGGSTFYLLKIRKSR